MEMIIDPTTKTLEAALLDQRIAGAFRGKKYCYVAYLRGRTGLWSIGIAIENENGFYPIEGWETYVSHIRARKFAAGMNKHIGVSEDDVNNLVASSMRKLQRLICY